MLRGWCSLRVSWSPTVSIKSGAQPSVGTSASAQGQTALPTQKIKLRHGDVLLVNSLTAVLRLNAFRRFLAEGFQAHMQVGWEVECMV